MKTVEEKSNMLANMEGFEPMNSVEAEKVEGGLVPNDETVIIIIIIKNE